MNENETQLLNQLAAKIKSRRLELNLSQEALANKCNLDRTYISLVERSKRNPSYLTTITSTTNWKHIPFIPLI